MKDEIKEILDKLQKVANRETASRNALMEMKDKDYQLLLDYITNLQEENERYKRIFEGKERFSKIMPDGTDFIILSKADYDRQQKDIELTAIELKSRNEKAIEYIKEDIYSEPNELYGLVDGEHLLNILRGEENEYN